jgi:ABC-type transport system involved in multi-copper enzyme maturation permease subunit
MKRIIFFVCICFICINHINGQTNFNTLLPDVLPTNPQTSEFMKYGEIPVGNYTGTPNISIPIYNLKTDMRSNKFDLSEKLIVSDMSELPYYIQKNIEKYKNWLD